jgi:hypothetical protein
MYFQPWKYPLIWKELISIKKKSNNKFGPPSKNLTSVMRGFKSAVTTESRKLGIKILHCRAEFINVLYEKSEHLKIFRSTLLIIQEIGQKRKFAE